MRKPIDQEEAMKQLFEKHLMPGEASMKNMTPPIFDERGAKIRVDIDGALYDGLITGTGVCVIYGDALIIDRLRDHHDGKEFVIADEVGEVSDDAWSSLEIDEPAPPRPEPFAKRILRYMLIWLAFTLACGIIGALLGRFWG